MKHSTNAKKVAVGGVVLLSWLAMAAGQSILQARPEEGRDEGRARKGLEMAPVPLNLRGKDVDLVGLGSYIVNAQADCNGCHSAGPVTEFLPGGNPAFGQLPAKVNPATYLGGGRSFGALAPGTPEIVSRNLTPDKSGLPMGDTFEKFLKTMRTGVDADLVHPTCKADSTGPCLPPPFQGDLLQIMPWPVFRQMTLHDLRAVYEYLSAVPCLEENHSLEGGSGKQVNRCG